MANTVFKILEIKTNLILKKSFKYCLYIRYITNKFIELYIYLKTINFYRVEKSVLTLKNIPHYDYA